MKLTEALTKILGKNCECHRERLPVHCRSCGSKNVYSKDGNSASITLDSIPGTITAQGFRCRRCGADFNEAIECEAPVHEVSAPTVEVVGESEARPRQIILEPRVGNAALSLLAERLLSDPNRRAALTRLFEDTHSRSKEQPLTSTP